MVAALVLLMGAAVTPSSSQASARQAVFANGGGAFFGSDARGRTPEARASTQIGVRLWYNRLLRLRGALTFQDVNALEGGVEVYPFADSFDRAEPYAFAGFGRYFSGNTDAQAVAPLGIGANYPLAPRLDLNVEMATRWTLVQPPGGDVNTVFSLAPSVGLSFDLGWMADRPAPDQPAFFAARGDDERPAEADDEGRMARAEEPASAAEPASAEETSEAEPDRRADGAAETSEEARTSLRGREEKMVAETAPMPMSTRQRRSGGAARRAPSPPSSVSDTGDAQTNEMHTVPAGTFVMGLTDEDPLDLQQAGRKRISVTPFSISQFEVSNAEYRAFLQELPPDRRQEMLPDSTIWEGARSRSTWKAYFRGEEYADYPVVGVTHEQASSYCQFYDKRLPTEAEWEYAARGDLVGSIYPWQGYEPRNNQGRYLANYNPDRGGYAADGYAFTAPGNAYPPSSWGLYHMSGNVAEWVQDKYHSSYADLSDFNPVYENPDEDRYIVRGGSWASNAFYIGVGVRDSQPGGEASPYIGFRCAGEAERQ